ncbi:MAG: glycosyltransferase family 4 protein [Chitinophagaceae bacterium]
MRIISLTYINSAEFDQPPDWIRRLYAFTGVWEEIGKQHEVFCIEQINYTGDYIHNGVQYYFRNYGKGVNRFPLRLHKLVKKIKPDIVLVRGLHFPLQLIQLRMTVGNNVKIICEHHADRPSIGWKKSLNRIAFRRVNIFHFTSAGNAEEWIRSGNITDASKCKEIQAGSTYFSGYNKQKNRQELQWRDGLHFIWTGRLDANKDPLTVLKAFAKFLLVEPSAHLHMIYLDDPLLPEIKKMLEVDELLAKAVLLHGKIPHEQLQRWYSAADFYISASHYESGGIALIEAMACGCIPVVTAIPSSMTAVGENGFYFKPGDADDLYEKLVETKSVLIDDFSKKVKDRFRRELSFEVIARRFFE